MESWFSVHTLHNVSLYPQRDVINSHRTARFTVPMEVSHDDIPQCAHVSRLILLNTIANKNAFSSIKWLFFPDRQHSVVLLNWKKVDGLKS